MTSRPNALGYIILATFVGTGIYALSRKSKAITKATACPPITQGRVNHFGIALQTAIFWFNDRTKPPPATVEADGSIRFPGPSTAKTYTPPVIVVTSDGKFWRYEGTPNTTVTPQPAPDALEAYCALG